MTRFARDPWGGVIQAGSFGTGYDLAFTSGASARTVALPAGCRVVRIKVTADVRVLLGPAGTVEAPSSGGAWLDAGETEYIRVPHERDAGAGIAVAVRGRSESGTANIVALD